jgi:hypothetical protein
MSPSESFTDPLSREIDYIWSGSNAGTVFPNTVNPFEDYFFSGEDIKVFMDGLFGPEDELDIASFAYSIRQEKQPLYGFWSYNYDHMMTGTRIISGEISLYTRDPGRMTRLLEKAADKRKEDASRAFEKAQGRPARVSPLRSRINSPEDDENIMQYWGTSQFDRITDDPYLNSLTREPRNIFSSHPPFNFVILYGTEEVAVSPLSGVAKDDLVISNTLDRYLFSDVNQRSVKSPDQANPLKIIIQEVNLMSMTTAYVPGGQAVVENYQFLARDQYFSRIEINNNYQVFDASAYSGATGVTGVQGQ